LKIGILGVGQAGHGLAAGEGEFDQLTGVDLKADFIERPAGPLFFQV
jgi:hypothetical protein